jgi:hypothetical protein
MLIIFPQFKHFPVGISMITFLRMGAPNGLRYAPSGVLVGGIRQRHFDGINFKPRKLPENAHAAKRQSDHHPAWFAKQTTCGASVAPALFAGDRVHAARCVGRVSIDANIFVHNGF